VLQDGSFLSTQSSLNVLNIFFIIGLTPQI
jgi:hypothetical protein